MKMAEFDTSKIPIETIFKIEEFVRENFNLKFGTGYNFETQMREWFLDGE